MAFNGTRLGKDRQRQIQEFRKGGWCDRGSVTLQLGGRGVLQAPSSGSRVGAPKTIIQTT